MTENILVDRCDHRNAFICRRIKKNNSISFGRQCPDCNNWREVPSASLDELTKQSLPKYDESLQQRLDAKRRSDYQAKEKSKNDAWFAKYNAYLQTDSWKERRRKVLFRDKYLCQACLYQRAAHVHHLTYERVFNEPLFDLIAVCEPCHESIHNKYRDKDTHDDETDIFA